MRRRQSLSLYAQTTHSLASSSHTPTTPPFSDRSVCVCVYTAPTEMWKGRLNEA
jgi:hypothetical protein